MQKRTSVARLTIRMAGTQITRFGVTSGGRLDSTVADHIGGSLCVLSSRAVTRCCAFGWCYPGLTIDSVGAVPALEARRRLAPVPSVAASSGGRG